MIQTPIDRLCSFGAHLLWVQLDELLPDRWAASHPESIRSYRQAENGPRGKDQGSPRPTTEASPPLPFDRSAGKRSGNVRLQESIATRI